ncbi:MAG: dTMP kinase [Dysgonamonadaceae bacterium]|jgi:dTMP kinase|nr:dTMP kinase [Dysgonamonadaceae bacterium]
MAGKLIVIEGLDGSGKSTQIELLKSKFNTKGVLYQYIHFPMLNKGIYGELIAEFLRGEYGSVKEVAPKLVALLFANDRKEHIDRIIKWLNNGCFVLADRYVNSNIAFQCAKIEDKSEKEKLKKWILEFEYNYNQLPLPYLSFFLDVPFDFITQSLSGERKGNERAYLKGRQDIHEESVILQKNVYNEYKQLLQEQSNFVRIDCCNENKEINSPEYISELIMNNLEV